MKSDISILLKYLASDYGAPVRLTEALGYRSTNTIHNWIKMKKLPRLKRTEILEFIQSELKKAS